MPIVVGCLVYPGQDQIDTTGPFEVVSRLPDVTVHIIGKTVAPVRDLEGLILTPEMAIADVPTLDLLVVPGGFGQQALMDDAEILSLIARQAASGRYLLSVCTGALLCGAAGVLRGRRATTHWASWDLLHYYGAVPDKSRVVVDGNLVSTAGVTAGLDGALTVAALLSGRDVAEAIQLAIEYAPDPPFQSGTPEQAPQAAVRAYQARYGEIHASREAAARRFAGGHAQGVG
jgi:cyclohexyl-isocyanide hydratase